MGAASEWKANPKRAPMGGGQGWGRRLWKGKVGAVAKQQAEGFVSAFAHLSPPSPGPLPPTHGPADHRAGHGVSPHAGGVLQSPFHPLWGPPEALSGPPCAASHAVHAMPGLAHLSSILGPGHSYTPSSQGTTWATTGTRLKPSVKIFNNLLPILGELRVLVTALES